MLYIYGDDKYPEGVPSRWFQMTEIVIIPGKSSILVTAYGLIDAQELFMVMDIQTRVVTPEQAKLELDKSTTTRLEKGYKTVENTRFRSLFKGDTVG